MMATDIQAYTEDFAVLANQETNVPMSIASAELMQLRWRLIEEEWNELQKELDKAPHVDQENCLKEICDLVYVLVGFCTAYGWDFDTAMKRVCDHNHRKVVNKAQMKLDLGGKVQKVDQPPVQLADCIPQR